MSALAFWDNAAVLLTGPLNAEQTDRQGCVNINEGGASAGRPRTRCCGLTYLDKRWLFICQVFKKPLLVAAEVCFPIASSQPSGKWG